MCVKNLFNFLFKSLPKMSNLVLILEGGGTQVMEGEFQLGGRNSPFLGFCMKRVYCGRMSYR